MARKTLGLLAAVLAVSSLQAAEPSGTIFSDCADCPEMIVLPPGTFRMGDDSALARDDEKPVHEVSVATFGIGRTEVTRAQYRVFAEATGRSAQGPCTTDRERDGRWQDSYDANWQDTGFPATDAHPVTCVTWAEAAAYASWLAEKTGKPYRLVAEAEWEYAARAGTTTQYWWGDTPEGMCTVANGPDDTVFAQFPGWSRAKGAACNDGEAFTAPVGSYAANAFGVFDLAGNVWEWTADCYAPNYLNHPSDGSAYVFDNCPRRGLRGGSWVYGMGDLRSSMRNGLPRPGQRGADIGFRVALSL